MRPFSDRMADVTPAIAAFVVTAGGVFGGLDSSFGAPIASIVGAVLAMLAIAATRPSADTWRALAPMFVVLAGAVGWGGAVSVGMFGAPALVPDLALPEMLGLIAAGCVLLAGCLIGRDRRMGSAADHVAGLATAVALLGLIAHATATTLSESLWQPGQQGRFAGTFGNANVAGTFYAAAAVLALGRVVRQADDHRRNGAATALWSLFGAILLTACLLTASRTAAATLGVAGLVLLALRIRRERVTRRGILVGVVAVVAVALAALLGSDFLIARSGTVDQDWQLRRLIWSHYASIAGGSPWLGHGLGSFQTVNLAYLSTPEVAAQLWAINAAHDVVIQLVIEGGLPFALAIAGVVVAILTGAIATIVRRQAGPTLIATVLAIGIILVNAMVDIALNVPAIALLFWFLLGLAWGTRRRDQVTPLIRSARHRSMNG